MAEDVFRLLIESLRGQIPSFAPQFHSREEAYQTLKQVTGEDHGYDADKWTSCRKKFNNKLRDLTKDLPPMSKEDMSEMWNAFLLHRREEEAADK